MRKSKLSKKRGSGKIKKKKKIVKSKVDSSLNKMDEMGQFVRVDLTGPGSFEKAGRVLGIIQDIGIQLLVSKDEVKRRLKDTNVRDLIV